MTSIDDYLADFESGRIDVRELEAGLAGHDIDEQQAERLLRAVEAGTVNGRLAYDEIRRLESILQQPRTPQPAADDATVVRTQPLVGHRDRGDTMLAAADATVVADAGRYPTSGVQRGNPATGSSQPQEANWSRPDLWRTTHADSIEEGTVLKDRFVLVELLGSGGMGVVFKARDRRRDEARDADPYVAIKILNDQFRDHPQALIALQRETTKSQELAHPNVVTVYDFDRDGTTVFMSMELMRGSSMAYYINSHLDGQDRAVALPLIQQMAEGLAYAHQRGFVHADFKPGNVFLIDDDRVKILDFGVARATQSAGQLDKEFNVDELGAMTPGYASVEMLQGETPVPADDVYALAVTIYQLLTGERPFGRRTALEAMEAGLVPKPIQALRRSEWKALKSGLAFRREDRPADAAEFLRRFRGMPTLAKVASAVIASLIVFVVFFAWRSVQDPGPDIPFDELPAAAQVRFTRLMDLADGLPPALANEAIAAFIEAYDIHPRNPVVSERLAQSVEEYVAGYRWPVKSALDKRADLETVRSWQESNELLARNGVLADFRDRLEREAAR